MFELLETSRCCGFQVALGDRLFVDSSVLDTAAGGYKALDKLSPFLPNSNCGEPIIGTHMCGEVLIACFHFASACVFCFP